MKATASPVVLLASVARQPHAGRAVPMTRQPRVAQLLPSRCSRAAAPAAAPWLRHETACRSCVGAQGIEEPKRICLRQKVAHWLDLCETATVRVNGPHDLHPTFLAYASSYGSITSARAGCQCSALENEDAGWEFQSHGEFSVDGNCIPLDIMILAQNERNTSAVRREVWPC